MNIRTLALLIAAASASLLAGCGKQAPQQAEAVGEVLPGSASDAMIPEDRLTSQPPLDPGIVRHPARGGAEGESTEAAQEQGTAAAAAPAATKAEAAKPATANPAE